jgi:hypothetical protein
VSRRVYAVENSPLVLIPIASLEIEYSVIGKNEGIDLPLLILTALSDPAPLTRFSTGPLVYESIQ